jgi:nucleoside 2-deoxyribosyltransferase
VKDLVGLQEYSRDVLAALNDIVTRLEPNQPTLCRAEFFIELAARVWKTTSGAGDHTTRVNATVDFLGQLAVWLGKDGLVELKENQSLSKQLLEIFNVVRTRIPKRVFLARWYPTVRDGEESEKAKLRLKQIKQALKDIEKDEGVHLDLIDMGTQKGGTFPIHAKMYEAIAGSDIILVDLTGVRPNVCVEAGFALNNHEKNRLIFIFQPSSKFENVPFDLNTFRYEPFKDTGEIPDKIKPHINSILQSAGAGR